MVERGDMLYVTLSNDEKKDIAIKMFKIRKGFDENDNVHVDENTLKGILTPVRTEDNSNDLWTVFNICQEKMIKGGFSTTSKDNKTRKQRGITSIKKDMEYNQKLWTAASKYLMAA